jgi:hypothetical protein
MLGDDRLRFGVCRTVRTEVCLPTQRKCHLDVLLVYCYYYYICITNNILTHVISHVYSSTIGT